MNGLLNAVRLACRKSRDTDRKQLVRNAAARAVDESDDKYGQCLRRLIFRSFVKECVLLE